MVPPALTGCAGRGQAALQSGLTLIELMVVIVLMAVLSAAVLVGQRDPDRQTLQRQAERLTAELEAARSFSRSSGRKLVWVPREGGFAIEGRGQGAPTQPWMHPEIEVQWGVNPATRKLVLVPREGGFAIEGRGQGAPTQPWMHPEIEVQWGVNPATRMLVLGPEPIIAAQSITLRLRALELKLVTDGLGPFRVQTTP